MSSELSPELLASVAVPVLEQAAFVFSERDPSPPAWEGEVLAVELAFSGPSAGRLLLVATPAFGAGLAANLLGLEPGAPELVDRAKDALGELVNMVCGILLERWQGAEAACKIGSPTVTSVDSVRAESLLASASTSVALLADERDHLRLAVLP
jgi:chemotaxis protein CheY-P-specific phosphatase CheC